MLSKGTLFERHSKVLLNVFRKLDLFSTHNLQFFQRILNLSVACLIIRLLITTLNSFQNIYFKFRETSSFNGFEKKIKIIQIHPSIIWIYYVIWLLFYKSKCRWLGDRSYITQCVKWPLPPPFLLPVTKFAHRFEFEYEWNMLS